MNKTKKAGCILIKPEERLVAIVHREKQNDYSFPKGHLEKNETLKECALRETREETKRECILLEKEPIYIENYVTPKGENVEVHYYLSKDNGPSNNKSTDTHPTYWLSYDKVEEKLTYPNLKKVWKNIKDKVEEYK